MEAFDNAPDQEKAALASKQGADMFATVVASLCRSTLAQLTGVLASHQRHLSWCALWNFAGGLERSPFMLRYLPPSQPRVPRKRPKFWQKPQLNRGQ